MNDPDRREIAAELGMRLIGDLVAEERERLEQRCDREVVAAVWRRQRAASGGGFNFKSPVKS